MTTAPETLSSSLPTRNKAEFPLLIAEKDPALHERLVTLFRAGGYNVTSAKDGKEVLKALHNHSGAVVVASLDLPGISGAELLQELEAFDPYAECLLLVAQNEVGALMETFDSERLYSYFWKPLAEPGDLVRAVARAFERRQLRLSNAYLLTELRDTSQELRALRSRAERLDKVAALGQMGTLSTLDVEGPATRLLAFTEYLRVRLEFRANEPLTETQIACLLDSLQEVENGVRGCCHAMQETLHYTRTHEEPPGPTLLTGVVEEAVRLMEYSKGDGAPIRIWHAPEQPPVLANPHRLRQALVNVLLNARQAARSEDTISVFTETWRDEEGETLGARVTVVDTGVGISGEALPHVFEPYFTTRPCPDSLGVGLTVARSIVREWGGDLTLESHPGRGTTVRFTMPLCTEIAVPEEISSLVAA